MQCGRISTTPTATSLSKTKEYRPVFFYKLRYKQLIKTKGEWKNKQTKKTDYTISCYDITIQIIPYNTFSFLLFRTKFYEAVRLLKMVNVTQHWDVATDTHHSNNTVDGRHQVLLMEYPRLHFRRDDLAGKINIFVTWLHQWINLQ